MLLPLSLAPGPKCEIWGQGNGSKGRSTCFACWSPESDLQMLENILYTEQRIAPSITSVWDPNQNKDPQNRNI